MTSRERVFRALTRKQLPDRVPIQFDLCKGLLEQFGKKLGIPVHYTTAYYEDVTYRISGNEIRIALGSDCVVVGASLPRGYQHPMDKDGCVTNEFGMKMKQGPLYMDLVANPLANASDAEIDDYQFPDPLAAGRFDDAEKYIQRYKNDYFIVGDIEVTIFAMARHLVGMERLLSDMAEEAPYVHGLLEKAMQFSLGIGRRLVELGVDGVWAGDDFGGQAGMLISPTMWREYYKEPYRRLYDGLKAARPDVMIMQHSDGAIAPILGEWAEAGMQVFNPVQPNVPGHDPQELKDKFGDRLSFWGAIDQQDLLPRGTAAQIEADVKAKIQALGKNGGYMCAPAHIIQADTSMENVAAFIAAVKRHGGY